MVQIVQKNFHIPTKLIIFIPLDIYLHFYDIYFIFEQDKNLYIFAPFKPTIPSDWDIVLYFIHILDTIKYHDFMLLLCLVNFIKGKMMVNVTFINIEVKSCFWWYFDGKVDVRLKIVRSSSRLLICHSSWSFDTELYFNEFKNKFSGFLLH